MAVLLVSPVCHGVIARRPSTNAIGGSRPAYRLKFSDTYEGADPEVGMMSGGYYCQDCDHGVAEWEVPREPQPGDVQISFARPASEIGTPASELASQPGTTIEQRLRYENFYRIAKSWGYD